LSHAEGHDVLVMGIPRFQRLFREAAGLDVDKNDLKRYRTFIDRKLDDLLVVARATAKANGRDIVEPWDLPITKGLQECIHAFDALDQEIELTPIIDQLTGHPIEPALRDDTEARLPRIVGGLSVALGRTFRIIEPDRPNPGSEEWDRATRIFDQLL
jgi:hypothetical protein